MLARTLLLFCSGLLAFGAPGFTLKKASCATGSCGSNSAGDVTTLFTLDLGPGANNPDLGSLVISASKGSDNLATPASLQWVGLPNGEVIQMLDFFGAIHQISTPNVFVNITSNSVSSFNVRLMNKAAQGSQSGPFFTWSSDSSHLIREYTIDNPDAGTANNRLRIRDVTSSATQEWVFTYTATNSGWNMSLPTGGSIDLVTTNNTSTSHLIIQRTRDASGNIIAQTSQIYTNFSWGDSILQESEGTDSDQRVRTYSYYTSGLPYTVDDMHEPLQSVVEPDGSWKYILTYDSSGRIVTELHGIDTDVTTTTSLCRKIVYSYSSLDSMVDDLTREPDSPRTVSEYWKDTLISKTYHIYTATYHKTIRCPDPSKAYTDSANLVSEVDYASGTMNVTSEINEDGTVRVHTYGTDGSGNSTETIDEGALASGTVTGKRTIVTTSPLGDLLSREAWDLASGTAGVKIESAVYGNFDAFNRPQQVTTLSGTVTMSNGCCGVDSDTDLDGVTTTSVRDSLGRVTQVQRLSITNFTAYDAANRPVVETRTGTDNSSIVMRKMAYDTAGFMTRQTNALGGTNIYARSKWGNGFDQIATTNAAGATNLQKFLANGKIDRVIGNSGAPVRYDYGVATKTYLGASRSFQYKKQTKLLADSSFTDSNETETSYFDGVGNLMIREFADGAQHVSEFNNKNQRIRDIDPDGVWTLYKYNTKGELYETAIDLNKNNAIDDGSGGTDRVSSTTTYYLANGASGNSRGADLRVTEQRAWANTGDTSGALIGKVETSTDGFKTWTTVYKDQTPTAVTTSSIMAYSTGGNRTLTVTRPDGSYSITAYLNGRVTSVTEKNSGGGQVVKTDFAYDAHGRQYKSTDARNGSTTLAFNNADLVYTSTTPAPGTGQAPQVTTTLYDWALRPYSVTQPDGGVVTTEYTSMGLVSKLYGARVYPVQYVYDAQGRLTNMITWRSYPSSGAATTTWEYSSTRGWLTKKTYEGQSTGVEYDYYPSGRLYTRKWQRTGTGGNRILTTYSYGTSSPSAHGDLTSIAYSNDPQSTPTVSFDYDRRGRKNTVSSSADSITYSYNDANLVTQDSHGSGELNGFNVTYGFNSYLQMNSLGANLATTLSQSFSYDTAGRLSVVTDGSYTSTYAYVSNSRLPSSLTHKQSTTTRLTTTYTYDYLNRVLEIKHAPGASGEIPSYFKYAYNNANQRITATLGDGSYWEYQYDTLGQVTSGKRYWSDGSPVAGQQFEYAFDTIGNRTSTKSGGDQNGKNLQSSTYTPNALNQYDQRTVPAVAPVLGIATAAATVTVNSASVYRKGEYFWKEVPVSNGSASVWQSLSIQAVNGASSTTTTGNEYVAKTPEVFSYDLDGNLTQDGRWTYTWDAENRLVKMVSATANGPQQTLAFKYDPLSRRIRKTVWNNTSGTGTAVTDIRFLYDRWLLLAELDALNSNAILRTYAWGADPSAGWRRANGVGGLLGVKNGSSSLDFPAFDALGNIALLTSASSGAVSGRYEFGPSDEMLRMTGSDASLLPLRSSTKYYDSETAHVYFGRRYLMTTTGRWLSTDPLAEADVPNLYEYTKNCRPNFVDPLGLLSTRDKVVFQHEIDATTLGIEQGLWSPCTGFAYLMGRLADKDRGLFNTGMTTFLRDAISYLASYDGVTARLGWLGTKLLGSKVTYAEEPYSNGKPWDQPAWLHQHGGDERFGFQGRAAGYIQFDKDNTGRHDHFLANFFAGFVVSGPVDDEVIGFVLGLLPSFGSDSIRDERDRILRELPGIDTENSSSDTYVNLLGRGFGGAMPLFVPDGKTLERMVYSGLCDERCGDRWLIRGPLSNSGIFD